MIDWWTDRNFILELRNSGDLILGVVVIAPLVNKEVYWQVTRQIAIYMEAEIPVFVLQSDCGAGRYCNSLRMQWQEHKLFEGALDEFDTAEQFFARIKGGQLVLWVRDDAGQTISAISLESALKRL
jgi:hypothetical protein